MEPPVTGAIPRIASTNSPCPLPSTPATPTISPHCTEKLTSRSLVTPASSTTDIPLTSTAVRSVTVASRVSGVGSSEPTMSSARSWAVTSSGLTLATDRPWRSTVIVSAISSTSSSL